MMVSQKGERYEYCYAWPHDEGGNLIPTPPLDDVITMVNNLAEQGWRVIAVTNGIPFLERLREPV